MENYTRKDVVRIIEQLLESPDQVVDYIENENSDWCPEKLLELSLSNIQDEIQEEDEDLENKKINFENELYILIKKYNVTIEVQKINGDGKLDKSRAMLAIIKDESNVEDFPAYINLGSKI